MLYIYGKLRSRKDYKFDAKEISKNSKVSFGTVSRILNNLEHTGFLIKTNNPKRLKRTFMVNERYADNRMDELMFIMKKAFVQTYLKKK